MAQSAALAEKFHYMCNALATYGQAAVAIFHFLREGKKLCVWGWFVRVWTELVDWTGGLDWCFGLQSGLVTTSPVRNPNLTTNGPVWKTLLFDYVPHFFPVEQ